MRVELVDGTVVDPTPAADDALVVWDDAGNPIMIVESDGDMQIKGGVYEYAL